MRKLLTIVIVAFATMTIGASAAQADTTLDIRSSVTGESCNTGGVPCPIEMDGVVTWNWIYGVPCQMRLDGAVWEDGSVEIYDADLWWQGECAEGLRQCTPSGYPDPWDTWYGRGVGIVESMTTYDFEVDFCLEGKVLPYIQSPATLNFDIVETPSGLELQQQGETPRYRDGEFTISGVEIHEIES